VSERRLEVAEVFRQHEKEFLDRWGDLLSRQQLKRSATSAHAAQAVLRIN
jgi:hypothetical protein